MSETIWKFPLSLQASQILDVPAGFRPLDVQIQNDQLCLWAWVRPDSRPSKVRIQIVGTGKDASSDGLNHIATVQMGAYVWHVFQDMT